jgi:hypothetical protein
VNKISDFVSDSVPEEQVCLTVTAPGFAGSKCLLRHLGYGIRIIIQEILVHISYQFKMQDYFYIREY